MRPTQKNNRTRGRGNRKTNGNNVNRVYDSSGPEGKVRGTPQQIIDKYLSLARDAQTSGDRVMAENFLQHAEHYQRILILANPGQPERRDNANGDGDEDSFSGGGGGEQPHAEERGERQDRSERGRRRDAPGEGEQPAPAPAQAQEPQPSPPEPAPARAETAPVDSGVSGLTTIDPEGSDGEGSLLVATEEETSASQPPRKRRGRPPKKAQAAETSEPAEPQPDGA
ncbi:hypothetical protein LNKW23_15190 [Paralimibaculum aggregatum]|uniref:DUF4167 domain-containing protein n=1 Tax=Paralimibaculum aggregatum TaxID=3036245 RepID=A0ABQ6LG58_9RHOB|nr:DUF4167 domain-containing protein [Limibaculum sp. NKW23]GMG82306.1 hypothetical protein LNKW23_15190 [Limibaculum sp. NKW23]